MQLSQYIQASIEHPERCEDAMLALHREGNASVLVVIDGLGGHQHQNKQGETVTGREAAQLVVQVLTEDLAALPLDISADPDGLAQQRLTAALNRANQVVYNQLNLELPLQQRVGAVASVVILCEDSQRLLCGQVGDTRAYLFSYGELLQICIDEDNIEMLVRQGAISEGDAARVNDIVNQYNGVREPTNIQGTISIHGQPYELYLAWRWFISGNSALGIPAANVVMNALGLYATDPKPQFSRLEISTGDSLLLCSDGVHKNLSEEEIIQRLRGDVGDPATALGEASLLRSKDEGNLRRNPDDIAALVARL